MNSLFRNKFVLLFNCIFLFILCSICVVANDEKALENVKISMSTDSKYVYPTIVSITSIMENSKKDIDYEFYILLSGNVNKNLKGKIMSLSKKYNNCHINTINMKNDFKSAFTSRHITSAAYYRLSLPSILNNIDKVLYMDVDTITEGDVSKLYHLNIDDYYLAGVKNPKFVSYFGKSYANMLKIKSMSEYINSGVMLLNLKKMREDNLEKKFRALSKHRFPYHDQDVINSVCYKKIYHLPFKYNMLMSYDIYNNNAYKTSLISKCFSKKDWDEGRKHPVIIHYHVGNKPWFSRRTRLADRWWKYANKSGFIKEIRARYHA